MRKKQEECEARAKINMNKQKTRRFFSFEAEAQLDLLPSVAFTEQLLLSPFYITFPSSFSSDLGPCRELKRSQSPGTDSIPLDRNYILGELPVARPASLIYIPTAK